VLSNKELAEKLSDSYSTARYYNGWINCIRMLRKRGYDDEEITDIIRSKHTRWAADYSKARYGHVTSADLSRYIDQYKNWDDEVKDLRAL
jgi:hypothetical protein